VAVDLKKSEKEKEPMDIDDFVEQPVELTGY
jgi:hypothetical protein